MKTLTYGSLFSGIGGIDLGLGRAGFECKWQVEIDPYATKVLAKHWPHVARYGDIRECGKHNLTPVDLIAGGFPCQDISDAGARAGIEGSKSGLWSEFYRVICELRPRYVLVENVSALLHRGIDRVLGDLSQGGYDAEWSTLSACAMGAPHMRERVFIVAYPRCEYEPRWLRNRYGTQTSCRPDIQTFRSQNRNFAQMDATPNRGLRANWWRTEPALDRMAPRVPARMDRLRGLGNAVVPQVAEYVGRCILNYAEMEGGIVA